MRFIKTRTKPQPDSVSARDVYLIFNSWDDYGYKTSRFIWLVDDDLQIHNLGVARIAARGMGDGVVPLDEEFDALGIDYCSLGEDQNYYEALRHLPQGLREDYLNNIRDCVFNPEIWRDFRNERAVQVSLLRGVSVRSVEDTFRRVLNGDPFLTDYNFKFKIDGGQVGPESVDLTFEVNRNSKPPTNVHAFIGRNGVGKTSLISGITRSLTQADQPGGFHLQGEMSIEDGWGGAESFAQLVTVSFSAFDSFEPLDDQLLEGNIRYDYIGLKTLERKDGKVYCRIKYSEEIINEFRDSLLKCMTVPRRDRWLDVMKIISSDPTIAALCPEDFNEKANNFTLDEICDEMCEIFQKSSSGHKVVLLTVVRLVELVDQKTLVLIDEPESHLHPPLLSSLIRAISFLLSKRNGVGVIATHSPVVLQEIPKTCVYFIERYGDQISFERPSFETFAENVGVLTREAFGLEVRLSGYNALLTESAEGKNYQEALAEFDGQVGGEGRAILRALVSVQG